MGNDFFQYGTAAPAPQAATPAREFPQDGNRAILAELSDEEWEKFIGFATRRRYPAGAVLLEVGQPGNALGFVASGTVEVMAPASAGASAPAPELRGEGDVFGMLGFLDGAPATVRVRARNSAEVLLLTREALLQLAAWQPRIALALMRDLGATVAQRLRRVQGGD